MSKRVILCITDSPFSHSGYGNQANKLMTEMVKRGYEVYAFACNYFPKGDEPKDENGFVIFNGIKCILLPKIWEGPEHLYASKEDVEFWFNKLNPDIVWSMNDFYRVVSYIEIGEKFVNKWVHSLAVDNEAPDELWPQHQRKLKFLTYMSKFGERMDSPRTGKMHYSKTIYLGSDDKAFFPLQNKREIKKKHGMDKDFVILTVGRHQPRKMIYHTARAVCKFLQTHKDAMWICKSDPNDSAMRDQPERERDLMGIVKSYGVENRVMFVPIALPDDQMNDLYNTADIFIHLSGGEGFGLAYSESMMAGTPLILTNSTTGPEMTQNEEIGFLVKVDTKKYVEHFKTTYDIASISDAMSKLDICYNDWKNDNSKMLKEMSKECVKFAVENFSIYKVADEWEKVFDRIIRYNNPVIWNSFFGKGVGFGAVSETMIPALEKIGYKMYVMDGMGGTSPILDPHIKELYENYLTDRDKVDYMKMAQVVCWLMESFEDVHGDYRLGWAMLESTKLRTFYLNKCNSMFGILTSCEHNKKIQQESGVTAPISIIPPCIDTDKFPEVIRNHEDAPFTFLHIGVVQPRKNSDKVVEGYISAFPDNGKTRFILKSNDFGELSWFQNRYGYRKDVEFIYTKTPLTQQELIKLYGRADCYVNISHGEGIGMPDIEAMATGLPVIGSNWDARGTFLNEDVGWMLKIKAWTVAYSDCVESNGEWADYDQEDYVRILQYVADHPEEAMEKGKVAAERIRNDFTPEQAALALDKVLMDIYFKKKNPIDTEMYGENYYTNIHKYNPDFEDVVSDEIIKRTGGASGKVLDMGCGTGFLMKHLLMKGVDVVGIDLSDYSVSHPIEGCEERIVKGDILNTGYLSKEFDLVISASVLEHIPENFIESALKEIARISKKAFIQIAIPINEDHAKFLLHEDPTHVTLKPIQWWMEKMNLAGLSIINNTDMTFVVEPKTYNPKRVLPGEKLLVGIPTKDRRVSLTRLMKSLKEQTTDRFDIMIVDDSRYDHINEDPDLLKEIDELSKRGIGTWMIRGKEINQAVAHSQIMDHAVTKGYKLVYRVDDDLTLNPDNIETILNEFIKDEKCEFAAMGGMLYNPYISMAEQQMPPDWERYPDFAGGLNPCVLFAQTMEYPKNVKERNDIQHLYSSYVYRPELLKSVGGFPTGLSAIAGREETLPLYELWLQGYKLKIITKAVSFHFCEQWGGCRSVDRHKAGEMFLKDNAEFEKRVKKLQEKYKKK